jgi:hypothetical protein
MPSSRFSVYRELAISLLEDVTDRVGQIGSVRLINCGASPEIVFAGPEKRGLGIHTRNRRGPAHCKRQDTKIRPVETESRNDDALQWEKLNGRLSEAGRHNRAIRIGAGFRHGFVASRPGEAYDS